MLWHGLLQEEADRFANEIQRKKDKERMDQQEILKMVRIFIHAGVAFSRDGLFGFNFRSCFHAFS